jgi:SAM-dependent methyltransferase
MSAFEGTCSICGRDGVFEPGELLRTFKRAVAGGYPCPSCGGILKYQGQADVLLHRYAREGSRSLAELVHEPTFRTLDVWEPGRRGPFREVLDELPGYVRSMYHPGLEGGTVIDGIRHENLMALSFLSDSLDVVITTDVFEHVRHPYVGFAEVFRVLRRGGLHVFTVPGTHPLRRETVERVDVSGDDDVFLLEPIYHDGTDLVYNDFGEDLIARLDGIGFPQ